MPDTLSRANAIHAAINADPLLPDCSGTHAMGYAFCQRFAALEAAHIDALTAAYADLSDAVRDVLEYDRDHPASGGLRTRLTHLFNVWNRVTIDRRTRV